MKLIVLAAIVVLAAGNTYSVNQPGTLYPEDFAGDFGSFCVGFKIDDVIDNSRTYDYPSSTGADDEISRGGRPIRIYTWYPASTEAGAERMTLGTYIEISASDYSGSRSSDIYPDALPIVRAPSGEQLTSIKILTTNGYKDAKPAEGLFPLILLGQGLYYENPITHFALCEYLASNGFVVATCPLMGTESPLVRLTVRDLESIVRDLEFVLKFSLDQPSVDRNRIGLVGFDMGGMAAQVLQMRNSGIDALMTMDAGIIFKHFSGLPGDHPSFNPKRMTSPWLHITQKSFMEPNRQYLDQTIWGMISDDRYLMLLDGIQHVNFTSYGLLDIPTPLQFYWRENILPNIPAYKAICNIGLRFMNAYLKEDQKDLSQLVDQAGSQDSNSIYTLEMKKGIIPGPTFDQFLNEIISGDFESAIMRIRRYKEDNPTWQFYPEEDINDFGYRILYTVNRPEIALEIFKLNLDMNPQSSNVYDSYAEALVTLGRYDEAIANYKKSLELNPENQNAQNMLNQLNNREPD